MPTDEVTGAEYGGVGVDGSLKISSQDVEKIKGLIARAIRQQVKGTEPDAVEPLTNLFKMEFARLLTDKYGRETITYNDVITHLDAFASHIGAEQKRDMSSVMSAYQAWHDNPEIAFDMSDEMPFNKTHATVGENIMLSLPYIAQAASAITDMLVNEQKAYQGTSPVVP